VMLRSLGLHNIYVLHHFCLVVPGKSLYWGGILCRHLLRKALLWLGGARSWGVGILLWALGWGRGWDWVCALVHLLEHRIIDVLQVRHDLWIEDAVSIFHMALDMPFVYFIRRFIWDFYVYCLLDWFGRRR